MDSAPEWVSATPYNPRQLAVFQAYLAHQAAKKSKGVAKFRSVRDCVKSIRFQKDNWKGGTFYPSATKGLTFKATETLPTAMQYEPTLLLERGRWFICYAEVMEVRRTSTDKVIALDPGVRTFMTGFDGLSFLEIGKYDISRIQRLCANLDKLLSHIGKSKGHSLKRYRYKMRKAASRIRVKISNLIKEIHHKLAAYLTKTYKLIFLPTFETSKMVNRGKRKLNTKTARAMLTWSHYKFKQTLKHHAVKRDCVVVDVTEEYTSKTCSKCGTVHTSLGGAKVFKCPICNFTYDRDKQGAFNIMLKALRDISESPDLPYSVNFG